MRRCAFVFPLFDDEDGDAVGVQRRFQHVIADGDVRLDGLDVDLAAVVGADLVDDVFIVVGKGDDARLLFAAEIAVCASTVPCLKSWKYTNS